MLKNTGLTIRIDSQLKEDFAAFCDNAGISVSAAVNLLASTSVKEEKIPFEIKMVKYDRKSKGNKETVRILIRIEDNLKDSFSKICKKLGMPMSMVIRMYMLQCVEEEKILFSTT